MHEWNIQARARACEACWHKEELAGVRAAPGFVSRWQGVFEAPPQRPDQVYKETAESLLRKLIELGGVRYLPASYILAVMLERKRVLKVREQLVRDGRRVFEYVHCKSVDMFTISDPDLRLDQLDQVQQEVASLLGHGLPQSVPLQPQCDATGVGSGSNPTDAPARQGAGPTQIEDAVGSAPGSAKPSN